jgi:hypothetical protein
MGATPEAVGTLIESIQLLEKATEAAVIISSSNIGINHTGRQNRALFLLAKLIAHDMSTLTILYAYRKSRKDTALLDHFSIASLARMILDTSLMTMYISHPSLSRDEWNLRRYVLYLHDLTNRKRFLTANKSEDAAFLSSYQSKKAALTDKIRRFAKCLHLSKEVTADLTSGQKVFVEGARGVVREAGWNVREFDFYQSYFSAYIHSHPVSFMRADQHNISSSDPSDYQLNFCAHAIRMAAEYTERTEQRVAAFSASGSGDPLGQVDD